MSSPSKLEKECNLSSVSAEDYKICMDKDHLPVYKLNIIHMTPNQAMNRAFMLLLVLLFLHYIKVITLPLKFIPQMK
jgi:hypothetical protein